ncbi:MAG: hypothetical protein DRI97_05820 [Bacteroidetes bacterium]|nr:MAG: hypothetical protein DRI97_05820 [Bacteroidota bacterium]RLD81732.1 MAG: hypothetical protein DRJ15_03620 [Bacteroidota bacterium]
MSEENHFFICRNESCKDETNFSGEALSGGKITTYQMPDEGELILCEHCKSEYKLVNGDPQLILGEIIIESQDANIKFFNQYESNHIHFKKLVLRNIDEADFKGRAISFNHCTIDELIIENVNITSTFYPISFSNCQIGSVSIINSQLIKASRNSYKSLYTFFGIVFFQTEITEGFSIEKSMFSVVVSSCKVKCQIKISQKSKIEIALSNNDHEPVIKTDKGSEVLQLFKITGRDPSKTLKKVTSSGELISDKSIDELHINPDEKNTSTLENCLIKKLIFQDGSSIEGMLHFKNCIIESIENRPNVFEQDLVFLGCTFREKLLVSRSRFKQSLIYELCTFAKGATFNNISIEDDLHLSYSDFKEGLYLAGNKCSGYVKCQVNTMQGKLNLEDNVIGRDVLIKSLNSDDNLIIYHNDIAGYLFLKQLHLKGKADINMLNADALTIEDIAVMQSMEITNSLINNDLSITRMQVKGETNFWFTKVDGLLKLIRSKFEDTIAVYFLESKLNIIANIDVAGEVKFNSCTFSQQTLTNRNLFHGEFNWGTMQTHNLFLSDNYIFDTAEIENIQALNYTIDDNAFVKGLEIKNSHLSEIKLNNNFALDYIKLNNLQTDDIFLAGNRITNEIMINHSRSVDLMFNFNTTAILNLYNSVFANITISECDELGDTNLSNLTVSRSFTVKDCIIEKELYMDRCKLDQDCLIEYNTASNFRLKNSVTSNIKFFRNFLSDFSSISDTKTGHLDILEVQSFRTWSFKKLESQHIRLENNHFKENLELISIKSNDCYVTDNYVTESILINDATANDLSVVNNVVYSVVAFPPSAEDEDKATEDEKVLLGMQIEHSNIENEINIRNNYTPEQLLIRTTLSDKFSYSRNRTRTSKISMGRYRQMYISNCEDIVDFSCNNVSVGKDLSFNNNQFNGEFIMLYCKIENDLEFKDNTFSDVHRIRNTSVFGTLSYEECSFSYAMFLQQNKFTAVHLGNVEVHSTIYFDHNVVEGNLSFGKGEFLNDSSTIIFARAIAIMENKIRNAEFNKVQFDSTVALRHNNFEGDLTFRDTSHQLSLDFTGCFVGGSFVFHNSSQQSGNGDLILDNTFIDKRLSFTNYIPASFSFINATFNGFEIPRNWRMKGKKLMKKKDKSYAASIEPEQGSSAGNRLKKFFFGDKKDFLIKDNIIQGGAYKDNDLPYGFMKEYYQEDTVLNAIPDNWRKLQEILFHDNEKLDQLDQSHRREDKATDEQLLRGYYVLYKQSIQEDFIPIYYKHFSDEGTQDMIKVAKYFSTVENNYKDESIKAVFAEVQAFFGVFHKALMAFNDHSLYQINNHRRMARKRCKNGIFTRLEEQYKVLRHIWGSNGELKEEDAAYYKWMHYKNVGEMRLAPWRSKPKYWMRYLLYEKVFGWGVDLYRIVLSTLGMVGLFTFIYFIIFHSNPELYVYWDNVKVYGTEITGWKPFVFAIQTTFSAGLGDWAPIGSGIIKIPMTINAILGVLFVTFLIGAYGRKMLR